MNLKVGYWNINKRDNSQIESFINDLVNAEQLDLLFLSEFENLDVTFIKSPYQVIPATPNCKKVLVIQKENLDYIIKNEEQRFVLVTSDLLNCSVVGLHLEDNSHGDASKDRLETLRRIMEAAYRTDYKNKIFVGDFNCMPYDDELVNYYVMHSVLFKKEMKSNNNQYKKHYNPMLLLLNEQNEMYGSYRYTNKKHSLYWYGYDQVIVSESLVDSIYDVKYLKTIKGISLMSKGGVSPSISDHLPLVFEIRGL